jgi:GTPase SAR1 family protein
MTVDIPLELRKLLRENNPFSSNIANEPWSNHSVDIPEINQEAFEFIRHLIDQQHDNPSLPLAGLALGEAGSGKTHLIGRIMKEYRKEGSKSLFVFVKPLFNSKQPLRHLLQEVVLSLSRNIDDDNGHCQLDYFVASIITDFFQHYLVEDRPDLINKKGNKEFLEQSRNDVYHIYHYFKQDKNAFDGLSQKAVNYLSGQLPDVSRQFLKILFQYTDESKRGTVRDWLKGSNIDDNDRKSIGLAEQRNESIKDVEDEARTMLLALGAIFARYKFTLILCFDQLEELRDKEKINGFGSMVFLLVNNAYGMIPLTFVRADLWNENFVSNLDRAFIDRVKGNQTFLKGCTIKQSEELITKRLERGLGADKPDTKTIIDAVLSQWREKNKGNKEDFRYEPREVITAANTIVQIVIEEKKTAIQPPPSSVVLAAEYQDCCKDAEVYFDSWDPDSEYLKRAAEFYFHSRLNKPPKPGGHKYLTWFDKLNGIPLACLINKEKCWQSVSAMIERGIGFLKANPGAFCIYVTDARCDFKPTWKKVAEQRKIFESLGGNMIVLDQTAAVRWYGLVSLSLKLGDLSVQEKDLLEFLRSDQFKPFENEGKFDKLLPQIKIKIDVTKTGSSAPSEADVYLKQVLETLKQFGLPVSPKDNGYLIGPRFVQLKIVPDLPKATVEKIQKVATNLQTPLEIEFKPLIQQQAGYISIDVPRKNTDVVTVSSLIQQGTTTRPKSDCVVPLGAAIDGTTFWINLANPISPSMLIGGQSGSGKSELLKSLVVGLSLANPDTRFDFTLIDPKHVTFDDTFRKKLRAELILDVQPALERLQELVEEMEQRYCLFVGKCSDILDYNGSASKKLTRKIILIDEFADLMVHKKTKEPLEEAIQRLGAKGRAAGFHLILATQQPVVKVVSGLIKANLQLKIAMKVSSQINSRIILDENGADSLLGNGDMLIGGSVPVQRLQSPMVSETDYAGLGK